MSREDALRIRHMRIAQRLSAHTRHLPPLVVGDCVHIQNQTGPHPTKWDKTGTVVEVRQFDQYVVRVDGSGRVTLRNRKFLRKFLPIVQRAPLVMVTTPQSTGSNANPRALPTTTLAPAPPRTDIQPTVAVSPPPSCPPVTPTDATPETPPSDPAPMVLMDPAPDAPCESSPPRMPRALRCLLPHNSPGLKELPSPCPDSPTVATRSVSRRQRQPQN